MIKFPKKKRAKRDSTKGADAVLWSLVSEYVRRSHASNAGYCQCATCGKVYHWKEIHAGHFISRKYKATKFNLQNIAPQCIKCNSFEHGRQIDMSHWVDSRYGAGTAEYLYNLSRTHVKLTRLWYEEQIKEFKKKLKEL